MMESSGLATSSHCNGGGSYGGAAEALERLATIDLIELCNEAKVERCRATRDLRSCGRLVKHVLVSCGHASLCEECSQRCDICPLCRMPIPKNNWRIRGRLYYECLEAGLIPRRCDDGLQEEGGNEGKMIDDVQRLCSFFDVALENNLVSLICHYVTDVCMDESAVSSDPVFAFLLDEVVVKDWCKRTFKSIGGELQGIYSCVVEEIKSKLDLLLKFSILLAGIINVLEVLESSFKGTFSARLQGLNHLQENVLKTKQHLDIVMWCVRHHFLEHVSSHYSNIESWRYAVLRRRSAAMKRSWPNSVKQSADSTTREGSLFIEDALSNLEIEQTHTQEMGEDFVAASLQKDGALPVCMSKMEGMATYYPFENLRAATDILFLHGSSDLVVAKQAIFLYYLFDRHWTVPSEKWRHIVDDFAATFNISRYSLLESFAFYLLDDDSEGALLEACHILPEISGPATHPKIAQVLLERGNPDAALMVLRWSGRDGSQSVSLEGAVTGVQVRVECALLTEAFMYQRMLCTKFKERKLKHGVPRDASDDVRDQCTSWMDWVETLVTEICCLCIRRKLVDRMIELPWNSDEEKYLHKCLLGYATECEDPSSTVGSLLVMFYLQRYRYPEAYQVHCKLQNIEQDLMSKNSMTEEVLFKMRSVIHWRAAVVEKSLELLPDVQQRQVRTGNLPEIGVSFANKPDLPATSDGPPAPNSASLLVPSVADSSVLLGMDLVAPSLKPSGFETPLTLAGSSRNTHFKAGSYGSKSLLQERFPNLERGPNPQNTITRKSEFDDIHILGVHHGTPSKSSQLSDFNRRSSRMLQKSHVQNHYKMVVPNLQQDELTYQFPDISPPLSQGAMVDPATTAISNYGFYSPASDLHPSTSNKPSTPDGPDKSWDNVPMDVSWRNGENGTLDEGSNKIGGPRWRCDETSEDEEDQSPEDTLFHKTPMRRVRRSRFARR